MANRQNLAVRLAPVLIPAAAVLVVLLAVPDILIPNFRDGWVDAWYYVAASMRLPDILREYGTLYQTERLSFTLPRYFVHQLVPPLTAIYLANAAILLAFGALLFLVGARYYGRRAAALAAAAGTVYSFSIHMSGSNYVDGAANVYLLAVLYFTGRAISPRSRPRDAVLAGGAYAALVVTHLFFLIYLPVLLAFAWFAGRGQCRWGVTALRFGAGVSIGFGAFALVNVVCGAPSPLPLRYSLEELSPPAPANGADKPALPTTWRWLVVSYWLLLPAALAAWSLIVSGVEARQKGWRPGRWLSPIRFLFLGTVAFAIALTGARIPVLSLPFYAGYLIPSTFLALGEAIAPAAALLSPRQLRLGLAALTTIPPLFLRWGGGVWGKTGVLVAVGALAMAVLVLVRPAALNRRRAVGAVVLLIVLSAAIDFATPDWGEQVRNGYRYSNMAWIYPDRENFPPHPSRKEGLASAAEAANVLAPLLSGKHYWFWYDSGGPLGMYFRCVASMFFAWTGGALFGEGYPDLPAHLDRLMRRRGGEVRLVVLNQTAGLRVPPGPVDFELTSSRELNAGGERYFAHLVTARLRPPVP